MPSSIQPNQAAQKPSICWRLSGVAADAVMNPSPISCPLCYASAMDGSKASPSQMGHCMTRDSSLPAGPHRRTVLEMGAAAMMASAAPAAAAPAKISDIVRMDARGLAGAIASRKLSSVEVMTAYLDHIDALNPKVNAIVALQDREGLLTQARERDAQVARGQIMGPLHGLPHAVKDLQSV